MKNKFQFLLVLLVACCTFAAKVETLSGLAAADSKPRRFIQ
jgi:hypothetical protein